MRPCRTPAPSVANLRHAPIAVAVSAAAALLLAGSGTAAAQTYFSYTGAVSTAPTDLLTGLNVSQPTYDWTGSSLAVGNGPVGSPAAGSFSALAGSTLTIDRLDIGNGGAGTGTFSLTGPSASLYLVGTAVTHKLNVGAWGIGTMNISGGAVLDATANLSSACTVNTCNVKIGNGAGSTGELNIDGNGSEFRSIGTFTVGHASVFTVLNGGFDFGTPGGTTNSTVNVTDRGRLLTQTAIVGNIPQDPGNTPGGEHANGTVNVNGTGSQWLISSNSISGGTASLTIGNRAGANGAVLVENGGTLTLKGAPAAVQNDFINIGVNGGSGSLTVRDAGSKLELTGYGGGIEVGRSGAGAAGSFSVQAGATASAVFLNVGRGAGSTGHVSLDGGETRLDLSGVGGYAGGGTGPAFAVIGWDGTGNMSVTDGAAFKVTDGYDTSATANRPPGFIVGYNNGGKGTVDIESGGSFEVLSTSITPLAGNPDNFNATGYIGLNPGSEGTVNIKTGGKLLITGQALSTAAHPRGTNFFIGGSSDTAAGGKGTVNLTGLGSELRVSGADAFIAVGRNGTGTLDLKNQAKVVVEGGGMNVGRGASGIGTLTLDDSFLELSGQQTSAAIGAFLTFGNRGGSGTATISNGSVVSIQNLGSAGASLSVGGTGLNPLGTGVLTLEGGSKGGSRIDVLAAPGLATVSIGHDGTGVATLKGGSRIDLGDGTAHVGRLVTTSPTAPPVYGNGSLTLESGSSFLAGVINIGGSSDVSAGGIGNVVVRGAGSELRASGPSAFIGVGRGGTGTLTIESGGTVTATAMSVGRNGGNGTLTVDNATLNLNGQQTGGNLVGANLAIGVGGDAGGLGGGTGIVDIKGGSTVNITNYTGVSNAGANLLLGGSTRYPQGDGTLNLSQGSRINVLAAAGVGGATTLGNVTIGNNGIGTATLSGASAIDVGAGNVYVARQSGSLGTLNINDGSTVNAGFVGIGVSAAGAASAPAGTGGTGLLNIGNGIGQSAVHAGRVEVGAGGTVNVNAGGTLNISSLGAANIAPALDRSVYVAQQAGSTGTLVLGSLTAPSATLQADFVGIGVNAKAVDNAGTLVQSNGGAGTLVLNGTVNANHFELGKDSLLTGNGDIHAGVSGPVVIGGTIAPGNSPGRIRIFCDVTMLADSKLILEINDRDGGPGVDLEIDQLVIGSDSTFDLTQLQIVFAFVGNTNPNDIDLDLNEFLRTEIDGQETSLSALFGKNGNPANWGSAVDSELFGFQSSAFDVTSFSFDAKTGEITGVEASPVPEPATYALVLLALGLMARRKRRAAAMH